MFGNVLHQGCLQSAETELERIVMDHRPGQVYRRRVAPLGQGVDLGAGGILQPHDFSRFVKCLSGRVINGSAKRRVAADTLHVIQVGMPARYDQCQERKFHRLFKK